jgi:hypothetical protein
MKTPLWDFYLSNEKFDKIKDFENMNLSIKRIDDHIEVKFKLTYSPNMYIYEQDGLYYMCVNHQTLVDAGFVEDKLKREREFFRTLYLYKDHYEFDWVKKDRLFHYKKGDGNFLRLIKIWVKRYTEIIKNIDPKDIRIEMSAGLDTRILSYFWRYNPYTYTVYTKPGKDETELAIKTIQYINDNFPCNLNITHEKKGITCKYELNGASIIHGYFVPTTRKDFKDVIGNSKVCNKAKHIVKDICPFYDKDILKLRGDYPGQVKLLLYYLLCKDKDLYRQPVMSFTRSPYVFDDNLTEFIRVNRIFSKDLKIEPEYFVEKQ